jgi:FixJ family two-component response regulator
MFPMEPLISVVDDDQSVSNALRRLLKSHGFATNIYTSAEQFLEDTQSMNSSCLIIDVSMPGMSGFSLHDYLVTKGWVIPTILMTASPTSDERRRAIATGVISYLAKPLREQVLLASIRRALDDASAL